MKQEHRPRDLADCAEFLTVAEAQEILRLGRSSAYALVREGVIPSVRVGNRLLVPRDALRAKLERMLAGDAYPR